MSVARSACTADRLVPRVSRAMRPRGRGPILRRSRAADATPTPIAYLRSRLDTPCPFITMSMRTEVPARMRTIPRGLALRRMSRVPGSRASSPDSDPGPVVGSRTLMLT